MQTNNNPFAEIGAIVIAVVLIAGGVVLRVLKEIDTGYGIFIFILAGTIFAGNLALKATSPTQQAALLNLTAQALQTQAQPAQLVQAPTPVTTPQVVAPPLVYSNPSFTNTASTMPQAIMTTQTSIPTVKPQ